MIRDFDQILDRRVRTAAFEWLAESIMRHGEVLCRLHHGAFDRFFVGVRPDCVIEVRPDVLVESDGPTLRHAIQGLHGQTIAIPHRVEDRPDLDSLTERYDRFLEVATAV